MVSANLFEQMKRVMKNKGLVYADLAPAMKLSESSVKRIFSKKNCTLEQLEEICAFIEISLSDLVLLAQKSRHSRSYLSEEQEKFFTENIDQFWFFRSLMITRSLEQSIADLKLCPKSARRKIKELEKYKLLELHAKDRVKITPEGYVKIRPGSQLQKLVYREWAPQFLSRAMNNESLESEDFKVFSATISSQLKKKFKARYSRLVSQTLKEAQLESLTGAEDRASFSAMLALGSERVGEIKFGEK